MNEIEIKTKLDTLAEYQAQRDLMEANKRALLDEAKIPAEVEAIVNLGMQEIGKVEMSFIPTFNALSKEEDAELAKIVIPDEIKAALVEIDRQRAAVKAARFAQDAEIRKRIQAIKTEIQARVEAETRGVYTAISQRRAEIEAEFSGKSEAVDENIRKLTDEIKDNVKFLRRSVKSDHFHAIYVSGRVTWNTDKMEAWTIDHPFLLAARKEGEPSCTLRRI